MYPSVSERMRPSVLPRRPNRVTALAVSAQPDTLSHIRGICGQSGWELRECSGCLQALSFLRHTTPDVVICDRVLYDGDWRVLLTAAQALPSFPAIIVTTPDADSCLWSEVLNEGGFDVLCQPLDRDETLRVMGAAVRRRENDRSLATRLLAASA